jgi:hypothetical protein
MNTGTVSVSAIANDIEVRNSSGNVVAKLTSDDQLIKPGETKVLTSLLPTRGLQEGNYEVTAKVDYTTGSAQKTSVIGLHPQLAAMAPKAEATQFKLPVPLWILILLAIIIVSIIVYRYTRED